MRWTVLLFRLVICFAVAGTSASWTTKAVQAASAATLSELKRVIEIFRKTMPIPMDRGAHE